MKKIRTTRIKQNISSVAIRPNFKRANKYADDLLRSLNFPKAPIELSDLTLKYNWKVVYEELYGADGYSAKIKLPSGDVGFVIFVASDMDGEKYSLETIICRQRFTIAHEIGHILLHSHIDWDNIDEAYAAVLEVEAHWFASRLLMPEYIFDHIADLDPEKLAEKCKVNFSAANKRIEKLSDKTKKTLIAQASKMVDFFSLSPGPIEDFKYPKEELVDLLEVLERDRDKTIIDSPINDIYTIQEFHWNQNELTELIESIQQELLSYEEVAVATLPDEIICFCCGHNHFLGFTDALPILCMNCEASLT
ncbi:MAG: ImmA/IrrE family metallo-endopeptidase [Candidatus Pristimantibacillus sp.]